ncbi:MAG TPA: HNH endonuclease [Firmicutes bacterium]|jgi:5-methylcytosine-specific restriction endonuclease McrA|nr:HNH endonuclease [Bacillota bacterium]
MKKATRQAVYGKYGGHCAYCGKKLEYKDMQVDHIDPQRHYYDQAKADRMANLNPSCRRCNHYKRGGTLGYFRELLKTLHQRVRNIYICKVAEDYGVITVNEWDGRFYFEKHDEEVV